MRNVTYDELAITGGIVNSLPDVGQVIDPGKELYSIEVMKMIYPVMLKSEHPVLIESLEVSIGDIIYKEQPVLKYRTEEC